MRRTRALKRCKSAEELFAQLRMFADQGERPLNSVNLATLLTRLPRAHGTLATKLSVAREVGPDLDILIGGGFTHPDSGNANTQGMANVTWGMLQLGLDKHQQC